MIPIRKSKTLQWTAHARAKMRQYGLSEGRIKRIMHSPKRIETGVAPKTVAMMQPAAVIREKGKEVWKKELWVMVQDLGKRRKVISAWRYPGVTKAGESLPPEILREIRRIV